MSLSHIAKRITADGDRNSVEDLHICKFACEIAHEAGDILMDMFPLGRFRDDGIQTKDAREIVSCADFASEAVLTNRIEECFGNHAILSEEGGGKTDINAPYLWHVDPLDGTTNYLHGHPMFCVSLGVQDMVDGKMAVGVVYLPYLKELFFAIRGKGAYLGSMSTPIECSKTKRLDDALIATGFAYDRDRFPNFQNFFELAKAARGIRRCGAAAVEMAYVAAGRYDAFWELGLKNHDVAAGALLIREAGGHVADFSAGENWLFGENIIASNASLFEAVRRKLIIT